MKDKYFKTPNFPTIISLEGIRGIVPVYGQYTMDSVPYIEFKYDGGTVIQLGGFDNDEEMEECLTALESQCLDVFTLQMLSK